MSMYILYNSKKCLGHKSMLTLIKPIFVEFRIEEFSYIWETNRANLFISVEIDFTI